MKTIKLTLREYEVLDRLQKELAERIKTAPTEESRRYLQGKLDGVNYALFEMRKSE